MKVKSPKNANHDEKLETFIVRIRTFNFKDKSLQFY